MSGDVELKENENGNNLTDWLHRLWPTSVIVGMVLVTVVGGLLLTYQDAPEERRPVVVVRPGPTQTPLPSATPVPLPTGTPRTSQTKRRASRNGDRQMMDAILYVLNTLAAGARKRTTRGHF